MTQLLHLNAAQGPGPDAKPRKPVPGQGGILPVPPTDPRLTTPEAVRPIKDKQRAEAMLFWPDPATEVDCPPWLWRGGHHDPMSRQPEQAMPSSDEMKGKWKQQVGSAKVAWGKLTDDELLESAGERQKLAGLIQERYAVTRDEAKRQVDGFFEKNSL